MLEVIARTRLLPMLMPSRWGDWLGLLAEALPDRTPVERAVREQHTVLVFELWGYRNPHLVRYDRALLPALLSQGDELGVRYGQDVVRWRLKRSLYE